MFAAGQRQRADEYKELLQYTSMLSFPRGAGGTLTRRVLIVAKDNVQQREAAIEAAKRMYPELQEIAAMIARRAHPAPELRMPEAFYRALVSPPTFQDEPDFEVKPRRRIGF
jgi:hypothetical protein